MTCGQLLLLVSLVGLVVGAWNCGSEFGDVASRTVRADAVFEGRAKRHLLSQKRRGSSGDSDPAPLAQVVFRIERILKGELEGVTPSRTNSSSSGSLVVVGFFGRLEDPSRCTGSLESVQVGFSYVVFVGNGTSSSAIQATAAMDQWSRKREIPSFVISSRPERTSSEVIRTVQSYNCSKCGKEPKSQLSVSKVSLDLGEKLQLHCRTMGHPNSVVTWFKDGTPLVHDKRRQIRHSKRSSRLRIKEISGMDFGVYQCIARNVLGISNVSSCTVSVKKQEIPPEKPHAEVCTDHSYCLNGGTCFILTPLEITFCQCSIGFEGGRCEEKHTGINAVRAFAETPSVVAVPQD